MCGCRSFLFGSKYPFCPYNKLCLPGFPAFSLDAVAISSWNSWLTFLSQSPETCENPSTIRSVYTFALICIHERRRVLQNRFTKAKFRWQGRIKSVWQKVGSLQQGEKWNGLLNNAQWLLVHYLAACIVRSLVHLTFFFFVCVCASKSIGSYSLSAHPSASPI